jgi:hypothetical protein
VSLHLLVEIAVASEIVIKQCSRCKQHLTLDNYTKSRYSKDGYRYQCKECNYIYTKSGDRDKWNQQYYVNAKKKSPEKFIWKQARHRAKHDYNGMEFDIQPEDIVIPTHCPYLGIEIRFFGERNQAPSLDRIDSSKGYTKDNIQVISSLANQMKTNATKEQLVAFAKGVIAMHSKEVELL